MEVVTEAEIEDVTGVWRGFWMMEGIPLRVR